MIVVSNTTPIISLSSIKQIALLKKLFGKVYMNILIRTDASQQIGSGHVMRCLSLANELRQKKARVSFICQELAGNMCYY
jgi:predicted nucleic acid-binding protein